MKNKYPVVKAWATVNDSTGHLMLIDVSFDNRECRMEAPAIYMTKVAAQHFKRDDERLVRVYITEARV